MSRIIRAYDPHIGVQTTNFSVFAKNYVGPRRLQTAHAHGLNALSQSSV